MKQTSAPSDAALPPDPGWGAATPPALAVVSLIVINALAVTDVARATSHEALRSLGFGRPFNWLIQDQTSKDPPFYPREQPFTSPWEHSVTIQVLPLLMNFALTMVILIGFRLAIRGLVSRRSDRTGRVHA